MASNEIVFKVKVEKDGNLSVVAKEAEKAAKGTDKLGKSTDNLEKKRSRYHKAEKGVGQAGLSSAKGFSKMAQSIGGGSSGLVGAYAVLAANIFALTAAFGALQRAAQVKQLEAGLTSLGTASGVALKSLSESLREATGNALSLEDSMRSVALASSAGFDSSSIQRLGDVARKASIALGRDTADSLNRLTKGAIKLEPELLDELGIMVRLDTATTDYARSVNKSVNDLTTFEKRQAFMNAVLEEGERKFSAMGDVPTNAYDQLSATFADLTKNLLGFLNNGLIPIVNFFAGSQVALFGAMLLFARTISAQMLPALANLGQGYAKSQHEASAASIAQLKNLKNLDGGSAGLKKLAKNFDPAIHGQKELNQMMKQATMSYARNEADLKRLELAEGDHTAAIARKKAMLAGSLSAIDDIGLAQKNLTSSTVEDSKANAVAAASTGNFKESMTLLSKAKKEMTEQTIKHNANLKTGEKGISGFSLAAKKGALNMRVFGAAFVNAIPLIGQIIFALGVFVSIAKKVIDFFKSNEQKEYEEILKKQAAANKELVESMKEISAYEAGRGKLINSVTQSYTAQFNVLTGLNKQMQALNKTGKTGGTFMGIDTTKKGGYKDMFTSMIEGGQITEEMLPELTKGMKKFQQEVVKAAVIEQEYGSLLDRDAKIMLNKTLPAMLKWPSIMHNLTQSTKEANQAIDEFANAISFKTDVDAVLASFTNMSNSMKDLGEGSAKTWVEGFKENAGANMEGLIDFDAIEAKSRAEQAKKQGVPAAWVQVDRLAELEQKYIKERVNALKVVFKREQGLQRLAKSKIASEKAHNKLLGSQLLMSGNAKKIEENKIDIAKEEMALLQSKQRLFKESTLLNEGDEEYTARVLAFTNQIAEAEERTVEYGQTKVGTAKENLRIAEHGVQAEKAINVELQKGIDLMKRATAARETILLNEAKAANRGKASNRGEGDLSAAQKYKMMYQEVNDDGFTLEKAKEEAIKEEAKLKTAMVNMEMDLLKFRMRVLIAEINAADDKNKLTGSARTDTSGLTKLIGQIGDEGTGGLRDSALAVITIEKDAALSELQQAKAEALQDVRTQLRTGTGTGQGSSREAAGVLSTGTGTVDTAADGTVTTVKKGEPIETSFLDKVDIFKTGLADLIENAKKLGPEGELIASVAGGALAIADAWGVAGTKIADSADKLEAGAAIATAVGQTIGQIGSIMAASSQAKIAGIDKEIDAEKKRDGKSKESLAKIKAMEKKKEAAQRKAFEQNKKMQMASVIASTAAAIMGVLSGIKDPLVTAPLAVAQAVIFGAMGAAQLAVIAGTSYSGGGSLGGGATGPSSISVGARNKSSDLSKSRSASGELAYFRGDRGIGGAESFRGAFYGKRHRASGGNTGYIVGEQGPELFMPDRPGTIVSSDDVSATGGSTNVTFSINAIDAAGVEDVLIQQQGNIIGMLRQAANSHGEDFFEDIDETTYTTPIAAGGAQRWGS